MKSNVFIIILALFIAKKMLVPVRKSYLGDRRGVINCALRIYQPVKQKTTPTFLPPMDKNTLKAGKSSIKLLQKSWFTVSSAVNDKDKTNSCLNYF